MRHIQSFWVCCLVWVNISATNKSRKDKLNSVHSEGACPSKVGNDEIKQMADTRYNSITTDREDGAIPIGLELFKSEAIIKTRAPLQNVTHQEGHAIRRPGPPGSRARVPSVDSGPGQCCDKAESETWLRKVLATMRCELSAPGIWPGVQGPAPQGPGLVRPRPAAAGPARRLRRRAGCQWGVAAAPNLRPEGTAAAGSSLSEVTIRLDS
jgi:hypothetical protein